MFSNEVTTAVWFTGVPATGKSTVARILHQRLIREDIPSVVLDSDELRALLTPNASYDDGERDAFYSIVTGLAARLAEAGVVVLVAATAPRRHHREGLRKRVERFHEVLLECSDAVLEQRDPKGLYAKSNAGLVTNLPGRGAVYEPPEEPEQVFDTSRESARDIADAVYEVLMGSDEVAGSEGVRNGGVQPTQVEHYLRRHGYPGAKLVALDPLGNEVQEGLKAHGYGRPLRVVFEVDGTRTSLVLRTMGSDEFGHDRRADRFEGMALAYDQFGHYPDHVQPIDMGVVTTQGHLRSCADGEPFLLTNYVEGELYAHDLHRLASAAMASSEDVDRAKALAVYLATLHAEPASPQKYVRAVRDLIGHGEGIFGLVDGYLPDDRVATPQRLHALERSVVDWRWSLRAHTNRARRTHGDFHPFNILFRDGSDLTVLDASRGGVGDPADDVVCLSMNYLFFSIVETGRFSGALRQLWDIFWSKYMARSRDLELFDLVAPYVAWRTLVLVCPKWYPNVNGDVRDRLLRFAERLLDGQAFRPDLIDVLID